MVGMVSHFVPATIPWEEGDNLPRWLLPSGLLQKHGIMSSLKLLADLQTTFRGTYFDFFEEQLFSVTYFKYTKVHVYFYVGNQNIVFLIKICF